MRDEEGVTRTFVLVIDGYPDKLEKRLPVDRHNQLDVEAGLGCVTIAGTPMVQIGELLVSRDRIVAIIPKDAMKGQAVQSR